MLSLLLVDDDVEFCGMLRDYFALHAVGLSVCHTGAEGLQRIGLAQHDLALLDLMLPGMDGLAVLRALGGLSKIPIIMLTALSEERECIDGLDHGADDYITKPINPRELLARVHAVLRRSRGAGPGGEEPVRPSLDFAHKCLRLQKQSISLTDVEYSILETLMRSAGAVCTRDQLAQEVFQRDFHPLDRSLDMHISRLRKKLDLVQQVRLTIRTVRSSGYALLQQPI